jgi:hypothetical protein
MEDGGWKKPERCQGNFCQGNYPESAHSHSLDRYSPDFGSFPQNDGSGIFLELRASSGLRRGIGVFYEPFEPFCGKSVEVPVAEQFTRGAEFFPAKSSQTQSNPVKPFFYFDPEEPPSIR